MYNILKKNWGLLFVIVFSIVPLLPLFHAGFFSMHDNTQVARVFEMGKSLRDGMFPVRWISDLGYGYGYPIFTFYAPLAFYVGAAFVLLGFSALIATKIMMGIGIVLAGICMYYLARSMWGETGGALAGILYMYAPYHALDIYVRGDVAEFFAYAFIPLAFLGFWRLYQTKKLRFCLVGAVDFAGIILSHNLTALMVTPFLLAFSIVLIFLSKKKLFAICYLLFAIVLGLLLSAFYWLPVPFEAQYTNVLSQVGGSADFHQHFVCINQLWNSPWGYGGSIPGCVDGISFALGKIYILFLIIGLILLPFIFQRSKLHATTLLGSIVGVGISLFLLLQYSEPVWNFTHVLAFLQYPWRFLLMVFFFLSIISGAGIWLFEQGKSAKKYVISFFSVLLVSIFLVIVQGKYFQPQTYYSVTSSYYTNPTALKWTASNISSEYMPKGFQTPKNQHQIVSQIFTLPQNNGEILSQDSKTQEKSVKILVKKQESLFIHIAYFPAWRGYIDDKETPILQEKSGMAIVVPAGVHMVRFIYKSTPIELIGDIISLFGICILILVIIRAYKKKIL